MPIYEYLCENCHEKNELLQKLDDKAPEECPNCKAKNSLKRVVTNSAFHLKGGGWYKDLYSSKKDKPAASEGQGKEATSTPSQKEGNVKKEAKKDD